MELHRPATPGIFVTGTGTDVGKTVVSCLIADQLRRFEAEQVPRSRVGVLKPIASGCRREREGLVADDAEDLAHAADFDPDIGDLTLVNPVRFREPVAPAVALQLKRGGPAKRDDNVPLPWDAIDHSLRRLDERCDWIVVEGVGGVMVPLEGPGRARHPRDFPLTVLDMIDAIGYPALIVADASLGTLNHTAMTVAMLRARRIPIAGVVLNRFHPGSDDVAMQTNSEWISAQNKVPVLGVIPDSEHTPHMAPWDVRDIHPAWREAIDATDWRGICRPAGKRRGVAR